MFDLPEELLVRLFRAEELSDRRSQPLVPIALLPLVEPPELDPVSDVE